ncbi:MAG: hypothetical protein ACREJQ_03110 [bacterium]
MRIFLSVFAGYAVMAAGIIVIFSLKGGDPTAPPGTGFLVLATVAGFLFAALGGFTTAVIAGPNAMKAVWALIAFGFVMWVVTYFMDKGQVPFAFHLANLVALVAGSFAGGYLRARPRPPKIP